MVPPRTRPDPHRPFVPLAEQTGLMRPLTDHVVALAVRQVAAWREAGIVVSVAINVSVRDLHDPQFAVALRERCEAEGVAAASLQLEITEGSLIDDPARTEEVLRELADFGRRSEPRRLRHRLLLAPAPQAAAGTRDQDRPLLRPAAAHRRRRCGDRSLDHRPGWGAGAAGGRGRGRDAGDLAPARGHGLRRCPGLVPRSADGARERDRVAARPAGRRRDNRLNRARPNP